MVNLGIGMPEGVAAHGHSYIRQNVEELLAADGFNENVRVMLRVAGR